MGSIIIFETMAGRMGHYDPTLLATWTHLRDLAAKRHIREIPLDQVRPGMVIAEDIHSLAGLVVISRGHEITPRLLQRLVNFSAGVGIEEPLRMILDD